MKLEDIKNIARVLSVLVVEKGDYSYIDKLGYAPSKDLAFYYLREALRDLHSLIRSGAFESENARKMLDKIDYRSVEEAIDGIVKISDKKDLRETLSLISSYALNFSAGLITKGTPGGAPESE